jgi:dipeptidyl aminopeptidase/acylaminoacyl peptidase
VLPEGFEFAPNGHSVYLTASDCGRVALYKLDLQPNASPNIIMRHGSVSAFHSLKQEKDGAGNLLVTSSSIVEPWIYQILDGDSGVESEPWVVSAASHVMKIGLSPKQVSEIYFEGSGDYCVQAWVVKPRGFDPSKKYPLCLLVHGGPMGAWADGWSTRVMIRMILKNTTCSRWLTFFK